MTLTFRDGPVAFIVMDYKSWVTKKKLPGVLVTVILGAIGSLIAAALLGVFDSARSAEVSGEIISPVQGDLVTASEDVTFKISGVPKDETVWIVTTDNKCQFPHGQSVSGPYSTEQTTFDDVSIGQPDDDNTWILQLVLAGPDATVAFENYNQNPEPAGGVCNRLEGVEIIDQVAVRRKAESVAAATTVPVLSSTVVSTPSPAVPGTPDTPTTSPPPDVTGQENPIVVDDFKSSEWKSEINNHPNSDTRHVVTVDAEGEDASIEWDLGPPGTNDDWGTNVWIWNEARCWEPSRQPIDSLTLSVDRRLDFALSGDEDLIESKSKLKIFESFFVRQGNNNYQLKSDFKNSEILTSETSYGLVPVKVTNVRQSDFEPGVDFGPSGGRICFGLHRSVTITKPAGLHQKSSFDHFVVSVTTVG